jgi:hypothetical protein
MTFPDDSAVERALDSPPAPAPAFRGDLGRHLTSDGVPPTRPERLWLWVALTAGGGAAALVAALLGVPT